MKLGELFDFMPKSKIGANSGLEIGSYPFFTSSNLVDKFSNDYQYDGEYLIIGDGGTGNCKYYSGKFSASDHNYVLKPKSGTNAKAVKYFLENDNYKILNQGFKGIGIKNVSKAYITNINYKYNQAFLESEIVARLDVITEEINNERNQLFAYDKMIKSRFINLGGGAL